MREALLALPFGFAVGALLGLVGGGGSILAVPVLVYVLGEPVRRATTESLLIVGTTALAGALAAARAGRVRWRAGLAFAAVGSAFAVAGAGLNRFVEPRAILLGFAGLLLAAAAAVLRPPPRPAAEPPPLPWLRVAVAGATTGLLTGFFGVGGGFVIVPVLTLALGLPLASAVSTSLLVIALTSGAALAAHLASGGIDVPLAAAFTASAVAGAIGGGALHGRVPERWLRRLLAALIVAVAGFLLAANVAS